MVNEKYPEDDNLRYGESVARNITLLTLFLGLIKLVAGWLTGLTVLVADGLHSLIDVLPILASWLGLRIALRPPDERFPYGYYKAESLGFLFVSLFLIVAAIELVLDAYHEWIGGEQPSYNPAVIIIPLFSAIISIGIYFYEVKGAKRSKSKSLEANAKETMFDVLSSLMIFIGLILNSIGLMNINPILILLISIMILKVGLESLRDAVYSLMDMTPISLSEVRSLILTIPQVKDVKDIRIRKAGPLIFGEGTILLPKSIDVIRGHQIAEQVSNMLKDRFGIERFTVHIEPYEKSHTFVIPVDEKGDPKNLKVSHQFGRARYLLLFKMGKRPSYKIISNPYTSKKIRAGLATSKLVERYHPDVVLVKNIGEISYHTLRDALIEIYQIPEDVQTVHQAIQSHLKGKTRLLTRPTRVK